MHSIFAILRASLLSAASYRVSLVFSLVGLVATIVPLYFIAGAIQPLIGEQIQTQGGEYFAFVLVGMITFMFLRTAMNSLPGAIGGGIGSGTLESLMSTRTPLPALLAGMVSYGFFWQCVRSLALVGTGVLLGANFLWGRSLLGIIIVGMIILAYLPIGLLAASLVLAFRTSGPLTGVVASASGLLGGVYYPTEVIPSWIEQLSAFLPLTYGLRALRGTVLSGAPLSTVLPDLGILAAFIVVLFILGAVSFHLAFRYARRAGTLAQY